MWDDIYHETIGGRPCPVRAVAGNPFPKRVLATLERQIEVEQGFKDVALWRKNETCLIGLGIEIFLRLRLYQSSEKEMLRIHCLYLRCIGT